MKIQQIVTEQENITTVDQFRSAFEEDEWKKIICGLATEIVNNNRGGLVTSGGGEDRVRNVYTRLWRNLGPGMGRNMTPANWRTRAQTFRIIFRSNNPTWNEIVTFLEPYTSTPDNIPGCSLAEPDPGSRSDPTPHTIEDRGTIVGLMSDKRGTISSVSELQDYMRTFLERLASTESRSEPDFQNKTWWDRITQNRNNALFGYWNDILLNYMENPDAPVEDLQLKDEINTTELEEYMWRFTLAADSLVGRERQTQRTSDE